MSVQTHPARDAVRQRFARAAEREGLTPMSMVVVVLAVVLGIVSFSILPELVLLVPVLCLSALAARLYDQYG